MSPCRLRTLALLLLPFLAVERVSSVAIDNSVAAPPDVECLDDRIRVWVHTRKYFAGRIYAKNRAEYPACIQGGYAPLKTSKPHFEVNFGQCGMTSLRSIDPRGMFYSLTIVVSFHPLIITKVDQAFHVKCFFEEANRGLTAELGISMIPTTEVGAHHGIPGCTYSIHQGTIQEVDRGQLGPPIQFARVGEKILHRWECADQMFGVLINKCYVTDGFGARAEVVDEAGCPLDPILITGIRYAANLTVAFAESHVFKFADKPGVWFFCQIQMCMKGGGMCYGVTPPQCSGNVVTTGQGYQAPPPPIAGPSGGGGYSGAAPPPVNQPVNYLPPPTGGNNYPRAAVNKDGEQLEIPGPIDLVFESDDVVGTAFEGEPNDPFNLEGALSGNLVESPAFPTSIVGDSGHESRPFPDDPVLLDSQDLKFLNSRNGISERRFSDASVKKESVEETDEQMRQRSPKFPKPKIVVPSMPRVQAVRPSVVVPFPEGFDENSFNETDLQQELNGGLIVYDVDEEAPMFLQRSKSSAESESVTTAGTAGAGVVATADCAISSKGLLILISALCAAVGALGLVLWITCLRLGRATGKKEAPPSPGSAEDPLSSVASMYRKAKRQSSEGRYSRASGDWEDERRERRGRRSSSQRRHERP